MLNIRVDRDVLDYFRKTRRGYQTRINAVLRAYVLAARKKRLAKKWHFASPKRAEADLETSPISSPRKAAAWTRPGA